MPPFKNVNLPDLPVAGSRRQVAAGKYCKLRFLAYFSKQISPVLSGYFNRE
jgi:hypothetical protein